MHCDTFYSQSCSRRLQTAAFSTIGTTLYDRGFGYGFASNRFGFSLCICGWNTWMQSRELSGQLSKPLRSAKLCLVVFMLNTTVASLVWGALIDGFPSHSLSYLLHNYTQSTPESEMMGLYLFSGSVLSFLPPFIFTCLNEIGLSMDLGLHLSICFLLVVCSFSCSLVTSRRLWTLPLCRSVSTEISVTSEIL
ncbi:hypothetical protein ACHAWO_009989 [Cyclotella atomus]|uniref:Uncharacterized protein n=1 Tax=Cyclotella atomus TaxID=382360 RepID=A0ABD3QHE9_9STRA